MDANQGSRKAYFIVFVLFILGIALGSVGTYLVTTRVQAARPIGGGTAPSHMAMFTRNLNLSPEQQTQVQAILSDTRAHYAELHQKLDPEYEQVRHESRERIRHILAPEQQAKFEELLRQMDEERRKHQTNP